MRRIRLVTRREIVADDKDGQDGPEGQEGREGQDGPEGQDGRDGQERQEGLDREERQDQPDTDDGLEGQAGQDRREADAAVDEGESLPRRGAAELKAILEALIFASPDPMTPKAMFKLLENEPREDVAAALAELKQDYERPGGLQWVEVAGGFQIVTRADLHEWVRKLFHERTTQKLSVQALENVPVIAYKQPITAPEIAEIRGVTSSGGVLTTLVERHLIKTVGRKQVIGRPFMYATT